MQILTKFTEYNDHCLTRLETLETQIRESLPQKSICHNISI